MRRLLIPLFLIAGCSGAPCGFDWGFGDSPLGIWPATVTRTKRLSFRIDRTRPWIIDLGRGSGRYGLETIRVDQDGRVEMCSMTTPEAGDPNRFGWEKAVAQLPAEAVKRLLDAVEENRLLEMQASYCAAGVCDGTQWTLWIRQGNRERAICCDNYFPAPIRRFAQELDEIIAETVGPNLRGERIPPGGDRNHERELWDSLER
jgi:hypothetical protein